MGFLVVIAATALGGEPSLLFVGNSYTTGNDLPARVAALLEEGAPGWDEVDHDQLTGGGRTFAEHAAELDAGPNAHTAALVESVGVFDTAILQEQSQTAGFDQNGGTWQQSLSAAGVLNDAVAEHGADTLFYLTWGRRDGDAMNPDRYPDFPTMQDHLTSGYLAYADELSTRGRPVFVAPAGLAFQSVWTSESDPTDPDSLFYRLYAPDGSHPSPLGSALVARIFFASLTGRSPVALVADADEHEPADREAIGAVAHEVVLTDPFGEVPMPFALTWAERSGEERTVEIGGGAVRYQILVKKPAGPAAVTFAEGLLAIQDTLQVSALDADPALAEVALDGGRLTVTSESAVHIELLSLSGGGEIEFSGLSGWSAEAFPATVLTALIDADPLTVVVPDGFVAIVDETSIVVDRVGAACGCGLGGGASWLWLLGLLPVAGRRNPGGRARATPRLAHSGSQSPRSQLNSAQ